MTALTYLKDLPVLWMNLDKSIERADQFRSLTKPLFGESHRISAIDGRNSSDDTRAYVWRDMVRRTHENDANGMFEHIRNFSATDEKLDHNRALRQKYSCTYALYETALLTLKTARGLGYQRFMVMEDDAVPRINALSETDEPSSEHQFNVWGGMIRMGAQKTDDARFLTGARLKWHTIHDPRMMFCATAYEVTSYAASWLLRDFIMRPTAVDVSWWYTMINIPAQRLMPVGFTQFGQSDRCVKVRTGMTQR